MREGGVPIHLDTSFLIRALVAGSREAQTLRDWLRAGRPVAMSTVAWSEFLCGPLASSDTDLARRVVRTHVALGIGEAERAARLFNDTGRRRGSLADCLVAAAAVMSGAELATSDRSDFERFTPLGLSLAE